MIEWMTHVKVTLTCPCIRTFTLWKCLLVCYVAPSWKRLHSFLNDSFFPFDSFAWQSFFSLWFMCVSLPTRHKISKIPRNSQELKRMNKKETRAAIMVMLWKIYFNWSRRKDELVYHDVCDLICHSPFNLYPQ